jgi:DNA modification methylase
VLINKIKSILKFNGSLGIVLGSGLDHIVDLLNDKIIIPYSKIDSFPSSTVDGHKGELISGYFLEKHILIARGRLHLYEGIKKEEGDFNTHITVKPVPLLEHIIRIFSKEGAMILDPFIGSGTTAIACKNTNRKCIGFELNKEYYDIALKRLKT